jgi:uncharacterized protein (DUF433 family)
MTLTDTWIPPLRVDSGGAVRIGKSRVTLEVLLGEYKRGATANEIAESFDTVPLADVHAVLSYYLDNREAVDAYLVQVEREGEEIRKRIESEPGYMEWRSEVVHRMRERQKAREESNQ